MKATELRTDTKLYRKRDFLFALFVASMVMVNTLGTKIISIVGSVLGKIELLRKEIDEKGYKTLIEVDGGINDKTGRLCIDSGIDILVAGSYLFGHDDMKERMEKIR